MIISLYSDLGFDKEVVEDGLACQSVVARRHPSNWRKSSTLARGIGCRVLTNNHHRSCEWGVDIDEEDLKINFKSYSDLTFAGLGVALCNYRPPFENWRQQKILNLWKCWQNQIRGKCTTDIKKHICTFCTGITNVTLTSKDCGERKNIGLNELSVKTIS